MISTDNSNKALSFEQARNLLPDEFRPNVELTDQKKLLNTSMGLVACHYSSLLKDGWWKISHNEDEIRNTVDYILFAIGSEGIVLFSCDVLLSFYDKNSTNSWGAKLNYFQGSNKSCPKGAFRLGFSISALFYKIKEFTITLPLLRECQNDILMLADFYLRHYNTEFGKNVKRFDNSSQKAMRLHSSPGNIRELKHVVRVAVLKSRGDIVSKENLEFNPLASCIHMNFRLDDTNFEKAKITAAIAHTGGNIVQAAKLLGISERALWAKRKKYGLK